MMYWRAARARAQRDARPASRPSGLSDTRDVRMTCDLCVLSALPQVVHSDADASAAGARQLADAQGA